MEVSGIRRREDPLSTVTRREIKSYKSESDKYESDMRTKVVGGNTDKIARSKRNERQMKSYKASKREREKL